MAIDIATHNLLPAPPADTSEQDQGSWFAEDLNEAGPYGLGKQNQRAAHFVVQWMLDRPAKAMLHPDELTVERVRRERGRFMISVTDEQAEKIAPFFRGDASAPQ